jgi:hypothetical protein
LPPVMLTLLTSTLNWVKAPISPSCIRSLVEIGTLAGHEDVYTVPVGLMISTVGGSAACALKAASAAEAIEIWTNFTGFLLESWLKAGVGLKPVFLPNRGALTALPAWKLNMYCERRWELKPPEKRGEKSLRTPIHMFTGRERWGVVPRQRGRDFRRDAIEEPEGKKRNQGVTASREPPVLRPCQLSSSLPERD